LAFQQEDHILVAEEEILYEIENQPRTSLVSIKKYNVKKNHSYSVSKVISFDVLFIKIG
jgi:hypothetical protein